MNHEPIGLLADEVRSFCARIGADALLVQGAGGNASWKDGDCLWVKASGTWLAEAKSRNIFVPVDLGELRREIAAGNFGANAIATGDSSLRPSIETMLHALMPQRVVLHVHAVEVLAHLVRPEPQLSIAAALGDSLHWCWVDYFKPGAHLAAAVAIELAKWPDSQVAFLRNHGVVIGADSVAVIEEILQLLVRRLGNELSTEWTEPAVTDSTLAASGYELCADPLIHGLVLDPALCARLQHDWVLYPDHAVFLGAAAAVVGISTSMAEVCAAAPKPGFVFVPGAGVYQSATATAAQLVQLRCYYDVLVRQRAGQRLCSLPSLAVAELLNWDAEKYRMSLTAA